MKRIERILNKFSKKDYDIFKATIEMLCSKGVGKGVYQDYAVLVSVIEILSACESIIREKND